MLGDDARERDRAAEAVEGLHRGASARGGGVSAGVAGAAAAAAADGA